MGLWTTADDDKLKLLYAGNILSCAGIAGHFPGRSRNSVIARVHRLKLPLRGAGRGPRRPKRESYPWLEEGKSERTWYRHADGKKSREPRIADHKVRVIKPTREQTEIRCAEVDPLNIPLLDLQPHHCRWPYGESPSVVFCGNGIFQGSYCGAHYFLSIGPGTSSEQAAHKVTRRHLEGTQ